MIVIYAGQIRTGVWVSDERGVYRAKDYFDGLNKSEKANMLATIERVCDVPQGVRNKEKFNSEGEGVWAIKKHQHRLYAYFSDDKLCIALGVRKKRNKANPNDLEVVRRIRSHNLGGAR